MNAKEKKKSRKSKEKRNTRNDMFHQAQTASAKVMFLIKPALHFGSGYGWP